MHNAYAINGYRCFEAVMVRQVAFELEARSRNAEACEPVLDNVFFNFETRFFEARLDPFHQLSEERKLFAMSVCPGTNLFIAGEPVDIMRFSGIDAVKRQRVGTAHGKAVYAEGIRYYARDLSPHALIERSHENTPASDRAEGISGSQLATTSDGSVMERTGQMRTRRDAFTKATISARVPSDSTAR